MNKFDKKYIMISTEFKNVTQNLGLFNNFSVKVANTLISVDEELYDIIDKIKKEEITELIDNSLANTKIEYEHMSFVEKRKQILSLEKKKFNNTLKTFIFDKIKTNINKIYKDKIIIDDEFVAIILNHHYILEPYLHIMYTVLKYNLTNNKLYIDIFISCTQFIALSVPKQQYVVPKFYDEDATNEKLEIMQTYELNIYKMIYDDLNNIYALNERINILIDYIKYNIVNNDIHHNIHLDFINIKIQKNIIQYLNILDVINDNKIKKNLCIPTVTNNNDIINMNYTIMYEYMIDKTIKLIKEKGILDRKKYVIIATTYNLLQLGVIFSNDGNDNHAEKILIKTLKNNKIQMNNVRIASDNDKIWIIRVYNNYNIGCGVPCQHCVNFLLKNGITNVLYSINKNKYLHMPLNENTISYITVGYKILNSDSLLYNDYLIKKRQRI